MAQKRLSVRDIVDGCSLEILVGEEHLSRTVTNIIASDLMSDVLSFREAGSLLLTGLTNAQVVRTAAVADLAAICFVRAKDPQPETIRLAEEHGIPLLVTALTMFEASGRLYAKGLPPAAKEEARADCQETG